MPTQCISEHRLSVMALAFSSLFSIPAFAEGEADDKLPHIEVSGERSHYDPRPGKVSTATRTAADLRDVPQTVNSVNMEDAASYGAQTMAGALAGVPGVTNNSDTRFDSFKIRGFSSAGDVFLDGIRDDAQYVRSLGNIERIEILKGPAAVLYGRGSGGGVINRISKQPGADVQSSLKLFAGSYSRLGFAADVNKVLSEQWAMRINAGREHANSFRDDVNSARQYIAPSLKWDDGRTSWLLQAEFSEFDRTPDRGMPAWRRNAGSPYQLPPAGRATTYGVPERDYIKDSMLYLRSTLEQRIDQDWKLRYTLGMLHLNSIFDNTFATNLEGANHSMVRRARWQQNMHQRNWQNNLELEGRAMTGAVRHDMLFGAEYSVERRQPTLYSRAPAGSVSLLNPSKAPDALAPPALFSNSLHRADGIALYAQDQLTLSSQWKMLAGVRWDRFAVDSTSRMGAGARAERTTSALSPRMGLVWSPLAEHSFYASYSKSFIPSGGADTVNLDTGASTVSNNALQPQSSRQFEVGVKSDWLEKKISTTLSVFQLDLYNRRTLISSNPNLFVTSGLERNRGIELSVDGQVAPSWFIRSGFAVQRSRIVDAPRCNRCATPDLQGKRSTGISGANGSLFVSYAPALGFFGEAGLVYEGSRYADVANRLDLPAYTRWDGKVGYRLPKLELTLAVTNLTNRQYYASSTAVTQIMPGAPRSVLLSAAYKF
ncbi:MULTISPECIES: TonB-dependent siderophore receptor [unclassified Herbaspirillum]|uniref:TonB-dependent receptor n=1 Tax=unclassified Herbaspirillum TaxID=2624150 RepID=UPI0011503F7B|nr:MULTISPECIES: TonB-dependent siderophore receptor [unclassified Herbaspirillum]MBB5391810.1 iron complex outermembrane receptor protein [Herbaspirillum sp. SJZ102]TQK02946.1 iron complex outermembrane receptor protein [Herbaspirillum sp. SJZ130]TQK06666.1 iron complex outermembrane receptor protein [Herbaspirillum sp. SJZ106]